MYNSTPSWVSDKLTAFFGKRNWKPDLVRIQNEIEKLGFDHFTDVAWQTECWQLSDNELVTYVADNLYVIAEYYFDDERYVSDTYSLMINNAGALFGFRKNQ